MTSCIVGKKIRAMGPGPLELLLFVVLAIKFGIFVNNFYTGFQILMKFILHIHLYALHIDMKTGASGPGLLQLYPFFIFRYFDMHLYSLGKEFRCPHARV